MTCQALGFRSTSAPTRPSRPPRRGRPKRGALGLLTFCAPDAVHTCRGQCARSTADPPRPLGTKLPTARVSGSSWPASPDATCVPQGTIRECLRARRTPSVRRATGPVDAIVPNLPRACASLPRAITASVPRRTAAVHSGCHPASEFLPGQAVGVRQTRVPSPKQ